MPKTPKKAKGPARSAKRKPAIKDLKAKNARSVKGGVSSNLALDPHKVTTTRLNIGNTAEKW